MTENRLSSCNSFNSTVKENICMETNKIFDSCRDRDCYENVKVFLTDCGQDIIERTSTIRVKDAEIASANITIDPVQFNKGFYTVTIRFYIKLLFEACVTNGRSQEFEGVTVVEKKVVLFGGESNINVFRSGNDPTDFCGHSEPVLKARNTPYAVVEAVDPVILRVKVREKCDQKCLCICTPHEVPESVTYNINGSITDCMNRMDTERYLTVSFGIFSVIRLVRPSQYMISAAEYNVPDKECISGCKEDDPCSIFKNMPFPISEFNPSSISDSKVIYDKKCGC